MTGRVGVPERTTQDEVLACLEHLGYMYGGNREYRKNSNVEDSALRSWLERQGIEPGLLERVVRQVRATAALPADGSLYDVNREFYSLLRYGVKIKVSQSDPTIRVPLIDWDNPHNNDFLIAEEVTVQGNPHTKRPDLVVYVNGIAVAVMELKRSLVSVSEGIRQTIGNQKKEFIRPFFTTVQLVFAGNTTEGLRYATTQTPERYWLRWKENGHGAQSLLADVEHLCTKERLLELIHDFVVFDRGVKKVCRHNQYFGIKAAQERVARREGGIIWHTQGSGKSLTMVWLAKWIREHQHDARVLIITDRTELDEQIEKGFKGVDEQIKRAKSAVDLLTLLSQAKPWLMCSLVHKFHGSNGEEDEDQGTSQYVAKLRELTKNGAFRAQGNLFVFVDEAHRTQSGKLHAAMKELLPDAMFIGFTGTPLLKSDKATTFETFGSYIHTYKYDEAVEDGVVLDLRYQARTIDQELTNNDKVDQWFEAKTRGLTDLSKASLKKRWGTLQKVFTSKDRLDKIVADIIMDFNCVPRLASGAGNAMLVCDSVYAACKAYEALCRYGFREHCAIITSYVPTPSGISKEDSGEGDTEELEKFQTYQTMLSEYFGVPAKEALTRVEEFEQKVKETFINSPGQMRLLIVVDKLLTGFDAPSATYLYIDKKMRDHGLFQAICRVNRLDGEDKTYGHIVDYRDLFANIGRAIDDYTKEGSPFEDYDNDDIDGVIYDRLIKGKETLDAAIEFLDALCEAVKAPKGTDEYREYFCGTEIGNMDQLKANEPKRVDLYKGTNALLRAYADIAAEMIAAGYTPTESEHISAKVKRYEQIAMEVRMAAGENQDLKQYDAGMRQLLDMFIHADASEELATLNQGLVHLIADKGLAALGVLPSRIKSNPKAAAAVITNNIRKTIVDERALNPKYYDKMSRLLDGLLDMARQDAIDYQEFLEKIVDLAGKVASGPDKNEYPTWAHTPARQALVDFGWPDDVDPQEVHNAVQTNKHDAWTQTKIKERQLKRDLAKAFPHLEENRSEGDRLMALLKQHDEYK